MWGTVSMCDWKKRESVCVCERDRESERAGESKCYVGVKRKEEKGEMV